MKYVTRETGNLFRDSVEPRPDADSDDRPWNRVREAGSRCDGGSTDGVERLASRAQTRSTRPTAGDNVGRAAARTAGRGRNEAPSLAATISQRRPSDQLTPSQCPQLDGDARERQQVSPFTDNSGRHLVQQRHAHGRQRISSPVRQLRLTLRLTVRQLR